MKLRIRAIESDLPTTIKPAIPADSPPDDHAPWRDSSLDLERGLEVIELPVEGEDGEPA